MTTNTRSTPVAEKSLVHSLAKGFRVLEAFDGRDPAMTLTEISVKTGLDAGTCYRLVKTLVKLGYLNQLEGTKRYSLGLKVLDLGFNALGRMDFRVAARPILRSLVREVNEAASLGVLEGLEIVYVERIHAGLARMGVDIRIGSRVPAYSTTIGHSVLAFLEKPQWQRIVNSSIEAGLPARPTISLAALERRFQQIQKQRHALSDEKYLLFPGLRVVAAPILDDDGHPQGALSVAGLSGAEPAETFLARTVKPLLEAATSLGRAMSLSGGAAIGFRA